MNADFLLQICFYTVFLQFTYVLEERVMTYLMLICDLLKDNLNENVRTTFVH